MLKFRNQNEVDESIARIDRFFDVLGRTPDDKGEENQKVFMEISRVLHEMVEEHGPIAMATIRMWGFEMDLSITSLLDHAKSKGIIK